MQTQQLEYGDYTHEYSVVYQDRKTVRLTVYPSLDVVLYCPEDYTQEKIEKFIKRKDDWIRSQLKDLKRLQRSKKQKEYISGESFLYLGRQYKLVVQEGTENVVKFDHGRIILTTDKSETNQVLLENWYTERAEEILQKQYKQMLKKFGYDSTPELIIRPMEKRWGSFTRGKRIILNPELIKASKECINYVIIHELCHMKHQNHSEEYYRFLRSKCPNWKQIKEKLEMRFAYQ